MALAMSGSRPGYLDNLYASRPPHHKNPSLSSSASTSSLRSATSPLEHRAVQPSPRPLSPALEEDQDDAGSVRSLRLTLSPRGKLRSLLNRRTYPQVKETTVEYQTDAAQNRAATRRPSLPKLQTAFSGTEKKAHRRQSKPLPAPPKPQAEELSSTTSTPGIAKAMYSVARMAMLVIIVL
ncbi:uncharacterized protein LTR77_007769 [Saxophila tyrrhenica]|uniref:Uncharacterized protein n=1 Tax=Saxophila tyrrhenica TaxID=1690608 RepID=A0AAV9P3I3_9PEZI|nr:hypothetical protein LTR77_007769 [Saxophila tyrrhenica]